MIAQPGSSPLRAFLAARYGRGFATRNEIIAWQAAGLRKLRQKIMPRSPFYAAFATAPMADWPVMNKALLMQHFTGINTRGIHLDTAMEVALRSEESRDFAPMIGDVAVGLSTGTSGQRGLFLTNKRERALWAAVMCGRFWPSPLLSQQRIAFFLRANNALYESLSNPLMQFHFYDLLNPFEGNLAALDAQKPTVLIAPAQILGQIAKAQEAGQLRIAPRRIISVAEVLSPEDSAIIETVFGQRPEQVYQCTEGVLAYTCRHGSLHLNERYIHFDRDEIEGGNGAFCPVITDFTRQTLPILRYRLDDVLIPDPTPCPCGCASQRLLRIEGRADDMLWWPGADGRPRLVPADAIRQAVATLPVPVRDYRVIEEAGQLTVWLDTTIPEIAGPAMQQALHKVAAGLGCQPPAITVKRGLPPDEGAKRRRVLVKRG
ncbi:adenylate synthase [Xinfangfangia sp. D13-10-4-6]|uniref:F390 synthetase-related protein n=1 Tax=Pseudogemmobacter hezensis TaxID=2737662 RepID=UPI001557E9FE|nr:F390 synthetase-related protein [Pseudogemmobacter hezensis]NPD16545.1 adenylate synthase [Pseudogemmobacter hezensis]